MEVEKLSKHVHKREQEICAHYSKDKKNNKKNTMPSAIQKENGAAASESNQGCNTIEGFLTLTVPSNKTIVEYCWIDGTMMNMRSKAKTVNGAVTCVSQLPDWNFDGSSTGQAPGEDSEVILKPRAIFRDPFRGGQHLLCMCECYDPQGNPLPSNSRAAAANIFEHAKVKGEEPWYGIEQEYALLDPETKWPYGWPAAGFPGPQGPYYCAVGADKISGRNICDAHYKACLYAGLNISGINGEVMPSQWEYQVGPCTGVEAGDQLWISRYILERICEIGNIIVTLDPKPIPGDWNGSGAHTNYSTKTMRSPGGMKEIEAAILRLEAAHHTHIKAYGEGNERRLTGKHETADMNTFSWGVANRGASVRVGRDTAKNGMGYMEDRRPSSNCDPYVVTSLIAKTTIL